ncbi:hypothetical protein TCAL_16544 [Tigriopus californicus]|uniref:Uncharacterized protein n=1 Tax=Tigriopus californicus TaxID=6832 RepID=A0A553NDK8_TIGCA|nr:hypothetical protein TCAL_16544 [Tigriopus californicus]
MLSVDRLASPKVAPTSVCLFWILDQYSSQPSPNENIASVLFFLTTSSPSINPCSFCGHVVTLKEILEDQLNHLYGM